MPKINVYLPDELAAAVRDAGVPVSAICQAALEKAVRDVEAARATDAAPDASARGRLFRRFTERARQATSNAQRAATERGDALVGTEHLLLGILEEGGNLAIKVLEALDVEPGDVRVELLASTAPGGSVPADRPRFSPPAKQALKRATIEALSLGHNYIGCEHLLLGVIGAEEGVASQVLRRMGVDIRAARRTAVMLLSGYAYAREQGGATGSSVPTTLAEILRRLEGIEARLAG